MSGFASPWKDSWSGWLCFPQEGFTILVALLPTERIADLSGFAPCKKDWPIWVSLPPIERITNLSGFASWRKDCRLERRCFLQEGLTNWVALVLLEGLLILMALLITGGIADLNLRFTQIQTEISTNLVLLIWPHIKWCHDLTLVKF